MYTIYDTNKFKEYIYYRRRERKIRLFYDIETFQYNQREGRENPTAYKNSVYSLAFSYFDNDRLCISIFNNFFDFFECFKDLFTTKKRPSIELIAHNSNKYDNHFMRYELIEYYNLPCYNQYLLNVKEEGNVNSIQLKELTKEEKEEGVILEKRVKSRNNLEMTFYIYGVKFYTTDNYVKTHTSIKSLGGRLLRVGALTPEELKTDYDYEKYNLEEDLSSEEVKEYSRRVFEGLNEEELKYIRNDVIILALSCKHYSKIFKGFDYESITFTRNILDSYNTNNLTNFQLLKTHGEGTSKMTLEYTDYTFNGDNLYDYLKSFYNGGLNFYNDNYIGEIIYSKVFGMDINSSYPAVMYKEKIPTFIYDFEEFEELTFINLEELESLPNSYTLYRTTRQVFDDFIITRIKSKVIKKMLVKYYSKHEYINLNSYTFKMIEKITGLKVEKLPVFSYIRWECLPFGSRDKIEEYYRIKTQGKNKHKMDMDDINNIKETKELVSYTYTQEEVDISKLNLNGLYGIPALRPYFNLFRWHGPELVNVENGFINSHRNIVFSTFVTSKSVYNLLAPLSYLSPEEIDKGFLYCDTDSLYMTKDISYKIPKDLFDPNNIGAWDIQNECIDKFYIMNHKKYAYEENGEITVKAGGVPQDSFNLNMSFEEFIDKQFKDGTKIINTRSIFNKQGVISIYPATTVLELGMVYPVYSYNPKREALKEEMFEEIKVVLNGHEEDTLYIESNLGCFSTADLYPIKHDNQGMDLSYYMLKEEYFKNLIY